MILNVPVVFTDVRDWARKVAGAVNALISRVEANRGNPINRATADPANPVAGDWYFNETTATARMYDGVVWRDLW